MSNAVGKALGGGGPEEIRSLHPSTWLSGVAPPARRRGGNRCSSDSGLGGLWRRSCCQGRVCAWLPFRNVYFLVSLTRCKMAEGRQPREEELVKGVSLDHRRIQPSDEYHQENTPQRTKITSPVKDVLISVSVSYNFPCT